MSSQRFPLATSMVSRRMSRTYSHQAFWRPVGPLGPAVSPVPVQTTVAWGVVGGARYSRSNHYQVARWAGLEGP